jgi:DNA helicase-2/ATP-dependent DNA helicase PcrA
LSRVLDLADRAEGFVPPGSKGFERLVPLREAIGQVLGVGPGSKRVRTQMSRMLERLGPELEILRRIPVDDIGKVSGAPMAEAVRRIRAGELEIAAGYDGEFGTVEIFAPGEREALAGQQTLLAVAEPADAGSRRPRALERPDPRPTAHNLQPGASSSKRPPTATDFLDELDAQQRRAVEAVAGPLLIVAGPGTGKTRTVVSRIAHQVRSGVVSPESVLAIAFTNQAADELAARIRAQVPGAAETSPLVTTFHGLGAGLLAELTGSRPEVLDDDGRLELVRRAAGGGTTAREARELVDRISLSKQSSDPCGVLFDESELLPVLSRYQELLEATGAVDVDDLILRPYQLLQTDPAAATRLAERWTSVSVDEYQDVNDVQAGLVQLLCPDGKNLCVIGDPDQAIYGFRGARPGHFARFVDSFPGTTRIRLETSYRLTAQIAAAAGGVVGATGALGTRTQGPPVELVAAPTVDSEAEQVLVRLERIIGGSSYFAVDSGRGDEAELGDVGFGDVAVLCRTRVQRRQILGALGRSGIPCHSVGEDEVHDPRSQKVAVMTMHAAKGREFDVIFATGLERGLVPLDREGFAADEDEERRLLYVAMTRARRLLVLSWAARRTLWGRRLPGERSPFLESLPERGVVRTSADLPKSKAASRQLRLF